MLPLVDILYLLSSLKRPTTIILINYFWMISTQYVLAKSPGFGGILPDFIEDKADISDCSRTCVIFQPAFDKAGTVPEISLPHEKEVLSERVAALLDWGSEAERQTCASSAKAAVENRPRAKRDTENFNACISKSLYCGKFSLTLWIEIHPYSHFLRVMRRKITREVYSYLSLKHPTHRRLKKLSSFQHIKHHPSKAFGQLRVREVLHHHLLLGVIAIHHGIINGFRKIT